VLEKFQNIFRIPELRSRILFTLGILAVCRLGTHVPMPGVNAQVIADASADVGGIFAFWDLFAGGAIKRASIFALGIMPHITASIIFSLLVTVIPALERLQKEGEAGRQKITRYTRYLTVCLCIVQSIPMSRQIVGLGLALDPGFGFTLTCMVSLTAGGVLLMWLGEQISDRGIGNGISLLIFVNIISRMPAVFLQIWGELRNNQMDVLTVLILLILLFVIIGAVVVLTQAQRRIPIQYPRQVRGRRSYGGARSYLPLRVLHAGVIPIIFASSMLMLPQMLVGLLSSDAIRDFIANWMHQSHWFYNVCNTVLIVFFAYFYTAIVFNPIQIADDLKKYGGFIPGIRPGRPTAAYLDFVMTRITLAGALALALVAMMPVFVSKVLGVDIGIASFFGGTSLLIVVGVALDTVRQIETHLLMRQYDGFMARGKIRGRR
jgi:preprotein translocase subunit SecY